ncbi:shikimate dehydrogenase [Cryptosporangium aurantiacum]|uniref:Shikimate dehydrogenase (NADP(+)) n=1 Tax=Cryptosporangium aurantiacum TaxID=134849 RepID=A0A1M7RLP2_9ACTN|nr:shikimate dehydrogenase [Cryptosporangium aurantiacum]SHN47032.1 shikimate dehydrogenase [Cryptosporangium aurantiacum]
MSLPSITSRGVDQVVVGLIGSGIGPSLSPALHEREAAHLGLDYTYRRFDLDELHRAPEAVGDLVDEARLAGYRGLNITHPCKQLVIPHLDELSRAASEIGAVNTVVFGQDGRTTGHNTDWSGFRNGLVSGLPDVRRDRVVLLGAGGAGAACAYALLSLDVQTVHVVDQDIARARELAERFGPDRTVAAGIDALPELLARADGLVHATPTGMAEHPGLPLPADLLRPELWVAEIVYRPLETELLRVARDAGCATLDGGAMAVHQAVAAMRLFTGIEPDADRMVRHLHELIRAENEEATDAP